MPVPIESIKRVDNTRYQDLKGYIVDNETEADFN
jgi:hypothetical protein